MDYPIYHETLSAAIDAAEYRAQISGAVIGDSLREAFATGGVPYGTTRSESVAIESLKGKKTRKSFHVSLYRMRSGRYELTCYIL